MKNSKAILVTLAMTLMLVVILAFMYLTGIKVLFFILCGIFSVLGIVCSDFWLMDWLTDDGKEEEDLQPVEVVAEPADPDDEDLTYEAIRRELEATL